MLHVNCGVSKDAGQDRTLRFPSIVKTFSIDYQRNNA